MRHSTKFANAIHLLTYAYLRSDRKMSSKILAQSIGATPVTVRQITSQLSKANLIETKVGSGKITFLKSPKEITLKEIFETVTNGKLIERNENTNHLCQVGKQMPEILNDEFTLIEDAALKEMSQITLADVINQVKL